MKWNEELPRRRIYSAVVLEQLFVKQCVLRTLCLNSYISDWEAPQGMLPSEEREYFGPKYNMLPRCSAGQDKTIVKGRWKNCIYTNLPYLVRQSRVSG